MTDEQFEKLIARIVGGMPASVLGLQSTRDLVLALARVILAEAGYRELVQALEETKDVIAGAGLVDEFPVWVIELIDSSLAKAQGEVHG
jgi:hypothetical protein